MRNQLSLAVVVTVALLLTVACGRSTGPIDVTVSAAASLGPALTEAVAAFEGTERSVKVRLNLGSSGALQKQIQQGAAVDLFLSAAQAPMDALVQDGLVEGAQVRTVAVNQVVLIRPASGDAFVGGWPDVATEQVVRMALGDPQHVPAGQYGKTVLTHLNLWDQVASKVVLGEDVRQVLRYVETGEVQAGIVYRTDAAGSEKVAVVAEAPPGSHPPIIYPIAVLTGAPQPEAAQRFADFLLSEAGQAIFTQHGFMTEE